MIRTRFLTLSSRTLPAGLLLTVAALFSLVAGPATAAEDPEQAARAVMSAFLDAFNARDEARWADTLQFPHVRLASQTVTVYPTREDFLAAMDLDAFARDNAWHHSTWDQMRAIQVSADKVHIAVLFSRFRADGTHISSFESLYVVEKVDGRWGIRARSSFAP